MKWAVLLSAAYAVSFFFSHGPGILLVNRPGLVWGFPPIYLWAVGWYGVELAILFAAYFLVWKSEEGEA